MLSLTRKIGQSIIIGDNDIEIKIVKLVGGNQVSIGIRADKSIAINRKEIYLKKKDDGSALNKNKPSSKKITYVVDGNKLFRGAVDLDLYRGDEND